MHPLRRFLLTGGRGGPITPTLLTAVVDGSTLTLTFNVAVAASSQDYSGFTLSIDGSNKTPVYLSGDGTNTIVMTPEVDPTPGQTVTLSYTPGIVESVADAIPLASFSNISVTNNTGTFFAVDGDFLGVDDVVFACMAVFLCLGW